MQDRPAKNVARWRLPDRKRLLATAAIFATIVGASLAAVAPFHLTHRGAVGSNRLPIISTHDMATHVAVMQQFDQVLRSGSYYPRWLPDGNRRYGLAVMNFYPPGFYYMTSLAHAMTGDWMTALWIVSALALAVSGLGLYGLSRAVHCRAASLLAALLYVLLPYHLMDLYWRGAMPEFTSFALIPPILYFAMRAGEQGRARHIAGMGFFYGLYLLTHLPTSYLFTYALAVYGLGWAALARDWRVAVRVGAGGALGLLLGAIYWLPAAVEMRHTQEVVSEIFPYHRTYITMIPGANYFDDLVTSVFAWQLGLVLAAWAALRATRGEAGGEAGGRQETQTRLWLGMALVALFMSTGFSIYVSRLIPKIEVAVPAWRWLTVGAPFAALVVAAAAERLWRVAGLARVRRWGLAAAVAAVVVGNLYVATYKVVVVATANGPQEPLPSLTSLSFNPKGASPPDRLPTTRDVTFEQGFGIVEVKRWEPLRREVQVANGMPAVVRLRTYDFPGWTARVNGAPVPIRRDEHGAITVEVPPGNNHLEFRFENTPPRIAGAALSGLALLLIAGLVARGLLAGRRAAAVDSP